MAKKENKTNKHFLKDFKAELKKVIWPTPKQLVNNTSAVLAIVLITAVIVFVLDVVFDLGNKYGSIVKDKYSTNTNTTEDTNNTDNGETKQDENSTEENTTSEENTTTEENQNTNSEGEQTNPEQ